MNLKQKRGKTKCSMLLNIVRNQWTLPLVTRQKYTILSTMRHVAHLFHSLTIRTHSESNFSYESHSHFENLCLCVPSTHNRIDVHSQSQLICFYFFLNINFKLKLKMIQRASEKKFCRYFLHLPRCSYKKREEEREWVRKKRRRMLSAKWNLGLLRKSCDWRDCRM